MAKGVSIDLIVDPKRAIQGIDDTQRHASGLSSALGKLGGVAAAGLKVLGVASLAAAGGTAAFLLSSVKAAGETEKVAAQTAAVIKSTGAAADRSAKQIGQLATQLSRMSGSDDEAIQAGENLLLTFTNIKGVTFDETTKSALDMSVAMGTDLQSSVLQLGKALNDPIKGVTKLQKVGVTFTQTQKDQIANYVKLGQTAKAQQVILDEVNREFGGSAAAFGNTWEGSVGKVKTAFGNIKEEIGGALLPALTSAAGALAGVFDAVTDNPKFQSWLNGLGARLSSGLKPVTDLLTNAASSSDPFATLVDGLTKASPVFAFIKSVLDGIKPVLPKIEASFSELGVVLGSGIAQYGPQIADAFGQIVTAIVPLIPQILELIPPILLLATQVIPPLASVLGMILPPIIQGLSFLLTSVLAPALNFIVNGLSGAATAAGAFFGLLAGNTSLQGFLAQIQGIAGPFGDMERWLLKTEQDFVNWGASILRAVADGVRGVVSFVTGLPGQIAAAAAGAGKWLVDAGANLIQGLIKGIQGAVGGVLSLVKSIGNNIADAFKSALGIHSPSTVFQGFGVNILRGLEAGLAAPNTIGALVGSLSSRVADGFGSPLNSRARSVIAGSYSGSGGNISGAAAAVPPVTVQAYMLPEQDPRIVGRQFGREFARAIAGAPA